MQLMAACTMLELARQRVGHRSSLGRACIGAELAKFVTAYSGAFGGNGLAPARSWPDWQTQYFGPQTVRPDETDTQPEGWFVCDFGSAATAIPRGRHRGMYCPGHGPSKVYPRAALRNIALVVASILRPTIVDSRGGRRPRDPSSATSRQDHEGDRRGCRIDLPMPYEIAIVLEELRSATTEGSALRKWVWRSDLRRPAACRKEAGARRRAHRLLARD
jgi:hypothetical protein